MTQPPKSPGRKITRLSYNMSVQEKRKERKESSAQLPIK
jgi:hypothetical protein